jgi:hypothetical protein
LFSSIGDFQNGAAVGSGAIPWIGPLSALIGWIVAKILKENHRTRLLSMLASSLALFCFTFIAVSSPAQAAGRGEVYSVSDVLVDITAQDSSKAREMGFAQAQQLAFDRLAKRVTLPEDLARIGAPQPTPLQLDQMVDGVDIQQESRSGVRYIARMAVNFDPNAVRTMLRNKGLNVLDTRTAPILVVPLFEGGAPEQLTAWRQAWQQGGFDGELAPVSVAPETVVGPPSWTQTQAAASAAGAATALFVTARIDGATLRVRMTEVSAGPGRDRGEFSTPWSVGADNGLTLLRAVAGAANERVQAEWKGKLAAGAGQRARIAATAAFKSQGEWLQVKKGLAQATQTLVSDIQIEAVAADGATLSFSHLGTDAELAAELGRYGVVYEAKGGGALLRATGTP